MLISPEDLACTLNNIAQNLIDVDSLSAGKNIHLVHWRVINDQLDMLKSDLMTLNSETSMISVLGVINLMLFYHSHNLGFITKNIAWSVRSYMWRHRCYATQKS